MILAALLALAALGEQPVMLWYPPDDSEIAGRPALGAIREENGGFTRIIYARRAVPGGVNSSLERHDYEDGGVYRIYLHGHELYCACDPDNGPLVSARIFRSREVYYLVADLRLQPLDYSYDAVEVRANGATHYRCNFRSRLRLAVSSGKQDRLRTLGDISNYLTDHGADLKADRCRVLP